MPNIISAQVVINEFSTYDSNDWIELYSPTDIDISGWILRDSASIMATIPEDTIISPTASSSGYLIVEVGRRLNQDKDEIKLFRSIDDTDPVDLIHYGGEGNICAPEENQTIGRNVNTNGFVRFASGTKGIINSGEEVTCPTPSPTPTPLASPNPPAGGEGGTPTATAIPTTNSTSTPKPTITPAKRTPAPESTVLGLRENLYTASPDSDISESKKYPFLASIFIFIGTGFMLGAFYPFLRTKWDGYNNRHEKNL